jgi:hypothetical protein
MPSAPTERVAPAVAAVGLAATVLVTWPLWSGRRTSPPMFPAIAWLSSWECAPVVIALCVAAVVAPKLAREAAGACAAVVVIAMLGDQVRIQPEVASLALLLAVLPWGATGRAIARWHLGSMWLWAGLHKALSLQWSVDGAAFIADSLHVERFRWVVALAVPAMEIALGLASLVPRLWPAVRLGGLALHLGIFVTLSPMFADWNRAVWAWNLALAVVAVLVFHRRADEQLVAGRLVAVVAAVLVLSPALFYVGSIDAYLSHNLYSSNTPVAVACGPDGSCVGFDTVEDLEVPLPPEPRLFRRWFDEACRPGTVLYVTGRATRFDDPPRHTERSCPATG